MARPKKETALVVEGNVLGGGIDALMQEALSKYSSHIKTGEELKSYCLTPTGIFLFDYANQGGLPDSLPSMIHGVKSSGKTTASLHYIANMQAKFPDKFAFYMAIERGSFSRDWAEKCGVDLSRLIVVDDALYGERYIALMEAAIKTNQLSCMVLDSVPELLPYEDIERPAEDESRMGANARMCGTMIKKYNACCQFLETQQTAIGGEFIASIPSIILINQRRELVGARYPTPTLPGGKRLEHFSTVIAEFKKSSIDEGETKIIKSNHRFTLGGGTNRNKTCGIKIADGEFELSVSDLHPRVPAGVIDDFSTVVKHAKDYGLLGGSGASQTLAVFPEKKFKTMAEMALHLVENDVEYGLLKASIVALSRVESGMVMIPPDDYLMGFCESDIAEVIERSKFASD